MSATKEVIECLGIAANAANGTKAENIVALDISDTLGVADAFLIASASSPRQVLAIAEEIEKQLYLRCRRKPTSREGLEEAAWVLLDFDDFVVHVMTDESREFYALEKLWADSPRLNIALDKPAEA
ncbi:MAG: ribosome silencing factor [Bifidobacteriaceae bacterium]|nr:ribosome silencing factor [Bifidobacteriaceae bacterium]